MLLAIEITAWVVLFTFALRGARWAYAIFVVLAFVWIPARTGFHLHRPPCQMQFTLDLALNSLVKYKHISLWGAFFLMTWVQFRRGRYALPIAAIATIAIGILIELETHALTQALRLAAFAGITSLVVFQWAFRDIYISAGLPQRLIALLNDFRDIQPNFESDGSTGDPRRNNQIAASGAAPTMYAVMVRPCRTWRAEPFGPVHLVRGDGQRVAMGLEMERHHRLECQEQRDDGDNLTSTLLQFVTRQ